MVYLTARDNKFPFSSPLWLTSTGCIPTQSFFIKRLWSFFSSDTAGQSLRAGSATSLAKNGVPPSIIQAIRRWASDAFKIYIQKNPVLIQALLFRQTAWASSSYIHTLDSWPFFTDFFFIFCFPTNHRLLQTFLPSQTAPYDMDITPTHTIHACTSLFSPSLLTSITMWSHHFILSLFI